MNKASAIDRTLADILRDRVILCVRLGEEAPVVEACRAAAQGGLKILELTLTTPGVLDAMQVLAGDDTLLVGGGTVLTVDDVRRVRDNGGRFVLSPVFDAEVLDEARRLDLLAVPGASTPAEILAAHRRGARLVKVFPSGALGGPAYLRAVRGPLPDIPLVPTNGPTADTLGDYIAEGAVAVGVGAEVFAGGFAMDTIERAARRVREAMEATR